MNLSEAKIFLFTFKTDQGDVQFPMRSETREEAVDKMQLTLQRMQIELSVDFPKVKDVVATPVAPPIENVPTSIPPEVLELRMDTLLADLGAGQLKGKAKADTVKLWTEFDLNENNYTGIIHELELIQSGQKEVPVKKK